jgi:hypothetical protein
MPFDPHLSEWAQGLPEEIVGFNRAITDIGTFAWMIYTSALLLLIAFIVRRASARSQSLGLLPVDDRNGERTGTRVEIPDRAGASGTPRRLRRL